MQGKKKSLVESAQITFRRVKLPRTQNNANIVFEICDTGYNFIASHNTRSVLSTWLKYKPDLIENIVIFLLAPSPL